jgi:hypothetical protein
MLTGYDKLLQSVNICFRETQPVRDEVYYMLKRLEEMQRDFETFSIVSAKLSDSLVKVNDEYSRALFPEISLLAVEMSNFKQISIIFLRDFRKTSVALKKKIKEGFTSLDDLHSLRTLFRIKVGLSSQELSRLMMFQMSLAIKVKQLQDKINS